MMGVEVRRKQKNYFEREAAAGRRLQYPQIRKLIGTGEVARTKLPGSLDDLLYLVFEYVDGGSVRDRLESEGFEAAEVRDLNFRVALGLALAHATGLTHRDVKPENILLPNGDVLSAKVADFGISRAQDVTAVTTGIGIGTATYMAPEQFKDSSSVTPAADIYSWGLVVWECLTGKVPYGCDDPMSTMDARLSAQPLADLVWNGFGCPELSMVLRKALAKQPEERFASILQFADGVVHAGAADGIWDSAVGEASGYTQDEVAALDADKDDWHQGGTRGDEELWPEEGVGETTTARTRGRKPNGAFIKAMTPSAALAEVVGSKPLPRTEVTKKIWAYIKRNGLQDKKNRRNIKADAKLRPIFKKDQVSMFEMTKLVSRHLR
jgi:serine/threonine protein kinase